VLEKRAAKTSVMEIDGGEGMKVTFIPRPLHVQGQDDRINV